MNRAITVIGLGFGDEGKGSIVDYLVREHDATTVVRFNGGAQAAHNVVTPDGRHHTFAQFGSGTFVDGVRTYLGPDVLVNPLNLFIENEHLIEVGVTDALDRLTIHPMAPLTTPFHVAANRLRELARGVGRHGSCGLGIGETKMDVLAGQALRAQHLDVDSLRVSLQAIQTRKRLEMLGGGPWHGSLEFLDEAQESWRVLNDKDVVEDTAEVFRTLAESVDIHELELEGTVIFEGAQGVLLDEAFGFQPYTTWSDCTTFRARRIIDDYPTGYWDEDTTIGVMRAYGTRHGPGPFPTYSAELTLQLPDEHNQFGEWQLNFDVGFTDLALANYALRAAGGIDHLAVTCMDRIEKLSKWRLCHDYLDPHDEVWRPFCAEVPTFDRQERVARSLMLAEPRYVEIDNPGILPELIAHYLGVPVGIVSHGPKAEDKRTLELTAPWLL